MDTQEIHSIIKYMTSDAHFGYLFRVVSARFLYSKFTILTIPYLVKRKSCCKGYFSRGKLFISTSSFNLRVSFWWASWRNSLKKYAIIPMFEVFIKLILKKLINTWILASY